MKFEIEDRVVVIATQEMVVIKEIIGKDQYLVENNGVTYPVFAMHLQYEMPIKNTIKQKPNSTISTKVQIIDTHTNDLQFCLIPQFIEQDYESVVDYFKVYLVNAGKQILDFEYKQICRNKTLFELNNNIIPGQNIYLHNIPFSFFSDGLRLQISWQEETNIIKKQNQTDEFLFNYKPKPAEIIEHINALLLNNTSSIFIPIIATKIKSQTLDIDIQRLVNQYNKKRISSNTVLFNKKTQLTKSSKYLIDVHIENIIPDYKHLSNYEILQLQLQTVETYIDLALRDNLNSMIIVHGLGTGKLRQEIHQLLARFNFIRKFTNDYHPLYGFGATEVYF